MRSSQRPLLMRARSSLAVIGERYPCTNATPYASISCEVGSLARGPRLNYLLRPPVAVERGPHGKDAFAAPVGDPG
jgi:hypothetical protein